MSLLESEQGAMQETARAIVSRWRLLLDFSTLCLGLAAFLLTGMPRQMAVISGAVLLALVLISRGLRTAWLWRERSDAARMFRFLAEDASPCFSTDGEGRVIYRNGAAHEVFGDDAEAMVKVLETHLAAPAAVLFRLQSRALATGAAFEDLSTKAGHLRLSVHRTGEDRFLWRLDEFRERGFGRGAEMLSLPMLVAGKSGAVLFCNDAMRRLLGRRPKSLAEVVPKGLARTGEEIVVSCASGTIRAIFAEVEGPAERREIFLLPSVTGGDRNAVLADFENVPVALLTFSADGTMTAGNRAAREILGESCVDGAMFHDLFEGLGRPVSDWLADVAAERLPGGAEVLRVNGREEDSFLQVTLRRIVEGARPGVLAVLNDATALKTLEAQFAQSQKMQAIGQLAGGIAHDFNNLLTAISGHCDLLLLRHGREDPEYADLVQIHQNANRAAALVSQLLAFSRKQTLKPERLEPDEVLADLTHLLNRLVGEKVELSLSRGEKLGPIRADKRQLEQVLINLVVNARDAMPKGGSIRMETETVHLAEEMKRDRASVPAGDYSVIRVIDQGIGIPADRLHKIFEPFFTTKRLGEGTGLGLSTAYGIVKQSGGFIFVDSVVGEGTTFQIYFPVHDGADGPAKPAVAPQKRPMIRQGEGVVLLVEDEAPVRAFASRALRLRGYTVLEAENAEDALKMLEDPSLVVDVFVTDVVMPGLDGPSWVKLALVDRPDVRVIFVSGYAEDCLSEDQRRIPNSVFLPKPFSLSDLTATVQGQSH